MDIIDYIFDLIQNIDPFWFMKLFTWARIGNLYFGGFLTLLFWLSIFIAVVTIDTTDILRLILEPIYNVLVYFKINPYNIWIVLQVIFIFIFKDKKLNSKKANILSYIFLGIIIFITLSVDYLSKSNYYGFLYLISILGGFITVTSLKTGFLDFDGPMAKPLSKLGEHSYVYYLWQYPIMTYSLEYFKWSDIDYNYTVVLQIIILIVLSEISYKFLIESKQGSIILRKIFLVIYVAILVFLPISTETNSEEVQNRANEIDNNLVTSDFNNVTHNNTKEGYDPLKSDNVDYIADRLLEKITLFKEQQNKKIEKKVDEVIEKKEDKDKIDNSIEGKDYTFIGDSVMKMGEPYIKEIFKGSSVDAKVSRQFTDLPKVLEALKDSKKLKNIVVIHLGTNGVINKESFESSMKLLEGKTVYLMNTVVPKPWEKSVNKSLKEWSEEYSNITIIDWYKYAKGEKKLFYKDATHPKPEGAKKYAEFILKSIKDKK